MRAFFIEWPARLFDGLFFAYQVWLAIIGIVCLTTAALWLALGLLGVPLP